MQVDAAQHFVLTERLAQAANGQRHAAHRDFRTAPQKLGLFDKFRAIDRLGIRLEKTKGFLHKHLSLFLESRMPG